MTTINVLFIGQSNMRGGFGATSGDNSIAPGARFWNNSETAFGSAYRAGQWGRYPLDRTDDAGSSYSNHMALAFGRDVTDVSGGPVRSVVIAKGGHCIEAFIRAATRTANGWAIPSGQSNLAPYIYDADQGARLACPPDGAFDVIIKHQGEANSVNSEAVYAEKEAALIADLEATGLKGPGTIYLSGVVHEAHAFYATHKAAVTAACAGAARAFCVDSAGLANLPASPLHFSGVGLSNYGRRFATKYLGAV